MKNCLNQEAVIMFIFKYFMLRPVVCEGLVIFCIERACRCKHDGGVQICDYARHGAGSGDAGLGALITSLEG